VLEQLTHDLILNMSYIRNWIWSFFINLIFFLILSLNLIIFLLEKILAMPIYIFYV
jgi:hypothetical protein